MRCRWRYCSGKTCNSRHGGQHHCDREFTWRNSHLVLPLIGFGVSVTPLRPRGRASPSTHGSARMMLNVTSADAEVHAV